MKIRKSTERFISCLITIVLLVGTLNYIAGIVERKKSDFKFQPFYSQGEDFDVFFMGSSHVIDGV